jgi:hypothetical protein
VAASPHLWNPPTLPHRVPVRLGSAAGTNTATLLDRLCETADYVRKVFAQDGAYQLPPGEPI